MDDDRRYFDGSHEPPEVPSVAPAAAVELRPDQAPEPPFDKPKRHWLLATCLILAILAVIGGTAYYEYRQAKATPRHSVAGQSATALKQAGAAPSQTPQVAGLQLDASKDYGNKYADGILPVGDGKYTAAGPQQGYIYACSGYAQNLATQNGGAMTRGPWFTDNNTEYDVNKKLHVEGSVMWTANFTNALSGNTRTIVTNDLPSQPTGIFPIMASDPAYQYDHNPNSIKGQTFTFSLSADPTYHATPTCETGEVGIMLTGVVLFSGLDAGGRDAGAWEVQDNCDGHPQSDGIYHYHTLSSCIKDTSVNAVIGYALDGFPITGPVISNDNILTTADLDECHGIVSPIMFNGKQVTMYHYVMTQDYPYSISCFRGTPITPPGQQPGQSQAQSQPPPTRP